MNFEKPTDHNQISKNIKVFSWRNFIKKKGMFFFLVIFLMAIMVGSTLIAQVNNPFRPNVAEVSSPSGLRQAPEQLQKSKKDIPREIKIYPIPDDIAYGQVFRHIEELNRKANEDEQGKGKDGSQLRNLYKNMAKLDERQARTLDMVAQKTNQELKRLDQQARQIIERIRAKAPNGRLAKGQAPPVPPPLLTELNDKRKNLILQAITELRANLGEQSFAKFHQFVEQNVKTGIKKRVSKNGEVR